MSISIQRLKRAGTGLVVIDLQERLVPAMAEPQRVVQNGVRLLKGMATLGLPVIVTEQYRKGLGPTVPEIAAATPGLAPLEKTVFSACGATGFGEALQAKSLSSVVLCGVEAHVCVTQTCLDLLERGLKVFVAADAVASRTPENCRLGLERMREAGATIVSTEMALFELLGGAGSDEFKKISALVK